MAMPVKVKYQPRRGRRARTCGVLLDLLSDLLGLSGIGDLSLGRW